MSSTSTPKTYDDLLEENELLCHRLEEAEETIEALPRSVAILDRRGSILSCNISFADLFEKPQQSLIGVNVGDFLQGEDRPRWLQLLQSATMGEAHGEVILRRGGDRLVPAAAILSTLPTDSVRLELVDLTAKRDCEAILEAKKQLEKSEERLRLAVEATGIGVIDTHFSSSGTEKVIEWSREARAAFGLADQVELSDEMILDCVFPDDRELVRRELEASLDPRGDGRFKVKHRVVRPDGEIRWISSRGQTTFGGEPPRPVRNVATVMDVTEHVRAAEALRAESVKARRLIDSNIIGVMLAEGERVSEANDAFLSMIGYTRSDLELGLLNWRSMTPLEFGRIDDRAIQELRDRGACTSYQKEFFRKDGSRVPVLIGAAVIDHNKPAWICFVQDVSPSKRAEKALREMNQRKDEFLATLAHELRNPLAPILTCLQLLRIEDDNPEARQQSYDVIERQTRQLTCLVDDLMDMVRISRGKIKLQKSLVDLAAVVRTAIESSRPLIADRGHRLDVVCLSSPISVEADPERLAQVIVNLLINAAKFTDPGGLITLAVGIEENQAVVRVKDSGVGIASEMLARVFDPFMQVDRTPQRSHAGLGIGLSLVRGLTQMHGGTVQVQSEGAGKGSEFIVRLPLFSNETAQEQPVNLEQEAGHGSPISRRIMVVDDNRDLADSFAKLLRLMGHEVRTTHDGRQVLEAARVFRPDLIFLDIGLPGMDGYAVAEALRDDTTLRSTLLVALTGYGAATDRQRTQEAGFWAHLVKPVRFTDVHELLDRLLGTENPRAS